MNPEDDIVLDHLDREMFGSQFRGEKVIKHNRSHHAAQDITDEIIKHELDDVYFEELGF